MLALKQSQKMGMNGGSRVVSSSSTRQEQRPTITSSFNRYSCCCLFKNAPLRYYTFILVIMASMIHISTFLQADLTSTASLIVVDHNNDVVSSTLWFSSTTTMTTTTDGVDNDMTKTTTNEEKRDQLLSSSSTVAIEEPSTTTTEMQQQQQKQQQQNSLSSSLLDISIPLSPSPATIQVIRPTTKNDDDIIIYGNETMYEYLKRMKCEPTIGCNRCLHRLKRRGTILDLCLEQCGCTATLLCSVDDHVQLKPLPIVATIHVNTTTTTSTSTTSTTSISNNNHKHRLIPRIIHQTWKESVENRLRYPHWSRFQQSFKHSGWEYHFYTDDDARQFLVEHFPPEVVEAHDVLIPGAFKADLFRYCVLLIQGGLYADIDVMLNAANLDMLIPHDVGFVIPLDHTPGELQGASHCLWNGLMATTPGHPFIAKAIEMIVNGVRNRYTSFDMDIRTCPHRAISIGHKWSVLHVTGPCLLGIAINKVLGRHGQHYFVVGKPELIPVNTTTTNIPGKTIIWKYDKDDLHAQRFMDINRNLIIATTNLANESSKSKQKKKKKQRRNNNNEQEEEQQDEHYSQTYSGKSTYGLKGVYINLERSHTEIRIITSYDDV